LTNGIVSLVVAMSFPATGSLCIPARSCSVLTVQ
jgi:hypothetical protein